MAVATQDHTAAAYARALVRTLNLSDRVDANLQEETGDSQAVIQDIDQIEPDGFSSGIGDRVLVTLTDGTVITLHVTDVSRP
jgi:hypothetical protein